MYAVLIHDDVETAKKMVEGKNQLIRVAEKGWRWKECQTQWGNVQAHWGVFAYMYRASMDFVDEMARRLPSNGCYCEVFLGMVCQSMGCKMESMEFSSSGSLNSGGLPPNSQQQDAQIMANLVHKYPNKWYHPNKFKENWRSITHFTEEYGALGHVRNRQGVANTPLPP